MIELGKSDSVVIDFELINAVDVRQFEGRHEVSVDRNQSRADERVDADKFQLNVLGLNTMEEIRVVKFDLRRLRRDGECMRGWETGFSFYFPIGKWYKKPLKNGKSGFPSPHDRQRCNYLERSPTVLGQLLDLNGINDVLHDGVGGRRVRFPLQMMIHFAYAQDSVFFQHPLRQSRCQGLVGGGDAVRTDAFHAGRKWGRRNDVLWQR